MKKLLLSLLILVSFASSAQRGNFGSFAKAGTAPAQISYTYATFNPSDKSANVTLSNGNLSAARNGGAGIVRSTIGKASGKWYWEVTLTSTTGTWDCFLGVANATAVLTGNLGANANGWSIVMDGGDYYNNGLVGFATGGTFPATTSMVFGFELNCGAGTLTVYQNNTALSPTPLFTNLQGQFVFPAISVQNQVVTVTANFGATAFTYTGHTGFNQGIYN